MWKNECSFVIELIQDLHIKVALTGIGHGSFYAHKFVDGGFDEEDGGGELVWAAWVRGREPVGAGHGYWGGREEEELVHVGEEGGVGVEREDAGVLSLVEG